MTRRGSLGLPESGKPGDGTGEGIVIVDARWAAEEPGGPRISAFIWGGKVRPTPTLPFGRWKGAA